MPTKTAFAYDASAGRIQSSLVHSIYYNRGNRDLLVGLHDDYEGVAYYLYPNVPGNVFDDFVAAGSKGRYFQSVKRNYGPSQYVGGFDDLELVKRTHSVTTGAVGSPQSWSVKSELSTTPQANYVSLAGGGNNIVLDNIATGNISASTINSPRRHEVEFTLDGGSPKHYTMTTTSVDEAVKALHEATAALGLTAKVKSVTTYFE